MAEFNSTHCYTGEEEFIFFGDHLRYNTLISPSIPVNSLNQIH